MKIYTRRGDHGSTQLFNGEEVWKDDVRLEALGSLDELNAWLGWIIVKTPWPDFREFLDSIQDDLHTIASELATPLRRGDSVVQLAGQSVQRLEGWIDRLEDELPPLQSFVKLGGCEPAALVHIARTVCRRAERRMAPLQRDKEIRPEPFTYVNRLSDFLFVLARAMNARSGIGDVPWRVKGG